MMKDYLAILGYETKGPRDSIKAAFRVCIIAHGDAWMEALEDRNATTHTYDEANSLKIEEAILGQYIAVFNNLDSEIKSHI